MEIFRLQPIVSANRLEGKNRPKGAPECGRYGVDLSVRSPAGDLDLLPGLVHYAQCLCSSVDRAIPS